MENTVFICPTCRQVYVTDSQTRICTDCDQETISTGIPEKVWWSYSKDERDRRAESIIASDPDVIKKKELEKRRVQEQTALESDYKTARSLPEDIRRINDFFEYDVVTVEDKLDGSVDTDAVRFELDTRAAKGWRLKNVFVNEIGKSALGAAVSGIGFGTNTTHDTVVMIFERRIKEKETHTDELKG